MPRHKASARKGRNAAGPSQAVVPAGPSQAVVPPTRKRKAKELATWPPGIGNPPKSTRRKQGPPA